MIINAFTVQLKDNVCVLWTNERFDLSELETLACLSHTERELLAQIPKPNRKQEFLLIRAMLNQHFNQKITLAKKLNGAPFLSNSSSYVSISHSANVVAIALSNSPVGVDVEVSFEKVLRLSTKFAHPSDLAVFDDVNEAIKATKAWCCKEAVYKIHQEKLRFFNIKLIRKNEHILANVLQDSVHGQHSVLTALLANAVIAVAQ